MSILHKILRYAQGVAGLSPDDILLVSYPKSGNTWVRFFLRHYIALSESGESHIDWEILDSTMPEFGVSDLRERWPYQSLPRFVKTHQRYLPVFGRRRSVLVVRDPRDVMVSYFQFEQSRVRKRFNGDFSAFIRHPRFGLERWFRHTRSWMNRATHTMAFEDLKQADAGQFLAMFNNLGIACDGERVLRAAAQSRYAEIRKLEDSGGRTESVNARFDGQFKFAREGGSGKWRKHFSEGDTGYFSTVAQGHAEVCQRFGIA